MGVAVCVCSVEMAAIMKTSELVSGGLLFS